MKLNEEKYIFRICGKKYHLETVMVGDSQIEKEPWVKLLGIHIDNELKIKLDLLYYKIYLKTPCTKAQN